MSTNDVLLQIEDPLVQMRMQINRARLMMHDLMMQYFHAVDKQPDEDSALLEAKSFRESTIRAEIIEDALYYMDEQLKDLELVLDQITSHQ